MVIEKELELYLENLAEQHPREVMRRLDLGSRVQKSWGLTYIIDDPDIDRRLGEFSEGAIPYGPIHRTLRNSQSGIFAVFNGSSEAPFSRAYESGVGECLEKSILVQLFAQRDRVSFLINGGLTEEGVVGVVPHAYNVVFKDGTPFLVDTQNPLAKDETGKITHPYIAPILGIKEGDCDFVVPQEWKQGRTYSIF